MSKPKTWCQYTGTRQSPPPFPRAHPHLKNDPESPAKVPGLYAVAAHRWQAMAPAQSPWLHEEVASRMVERLQWFRQKPGSWLHWEPLSGGVQAHRRLRELMSEAVCHVAAQRLPQALQATREAPAPSWNPLRWGQARSPAAADDDTRVDMLWANMGLHHEPEPQVLLQRWYRQIKVQGFLMFSCLGPDSLRELRAVFASEGWPAPSHAFTDMHDWGDMLVHSGFAEPVMDMERIQLSYSTAQALLDELRGLGRNLNENRFAGLRARRWHAHLCRALESGLPRADDGRLLLTFEIVYGHAFKPVPRVRMASNSAVSVDDMRDMLRSGRP